MSSNKHSSKYTNHSKEPDYSYRVSFTFYYSISRKKNLKENISITL